MSAVDVLGLVGMTVDQVRFDACVDGGGFGLIYRGRHLGMDEVVAIKCMRLATTQRIDDAVREQLNLRFRDETRILYRLSQGNLDIVRALGSGTLVSPATNEVTPYMVLEWLDGMTLSADLRRRRADGSGPRTLQETVDLLDSAAGALSYAHTHDVVHRDIKPGNLYIAQTREGTRMKVLDFGLAKILSNDAIGMKPSVETQAGTHFCSPSYGAPEQFMSKLGPIGPWTDVYSFTMVILECLIGEKVRPAVNLADGLVKALDPKTGSPRASALGLQLPKPVEDLFARAVAKEPLERPHDVGVFWTALRELMTSTSKAIDFKATVADADFESAMLKVREIQAARAQQPPQAAPAPPPPPPEPEPPRGSPFAGTMLMEAAPSGAPHLVSQPPVPNATSPLAGTILPANTPGNAMAPTASPLASSAATAAPARPPMVHASTMFQPMQAAMPPQMGRPGSVPPPAMSGNPNVGGQHGSRPPPAMGHQAPMPPMPPPTNISGFGASGPPPANVGSVPPHGQPANVGSAPPHGGQPANVRRTDPRPSYVDNAPVTIPKSSAPLVLGILAFLLLAIGGGLFAYFRMKH